MRALAECERAALLDVVALVSVVDVPWMDVPGVVSADVEREAATARAQAQMGISPDTWPDDAA